MEFSSKEADKKVGGSGVQKMISPGNVVARVLDITLEVPPYDANAYNVMIHLESQPLGEGYEGLPIDKDVPSLGFYEGQVARVQSHQYSYSDYTNKEGKTTTKSDMIFRWVWNFAKELGVTDQMIKNNVEGDTIEEFIQNAKPYLINKSRWIHFCIAGSEYENAKGYTQYRLFLPKQEKMKVPYEIFIEGSAPRKLIMFTEDQHIKKKKASDSVSEFKGRDESTELELS